LRLLQPIPPCFLLYAVKNCAAAATYGRFTAFFYPFKMPVPFLYLLLPRKNASRLKVTDVTEMTNPTIPVHNPAMLNAFVAFIYFPSFPARAISTGLDTFSHNST